MSQWTHVCGCIRVDSLDHETMQENLRNILGKTLFYRSPYEEWEEQYEHPELYTPTGSEGGIEYDIWENPNHSHLDAYKISIWGDLRDYCSVKEITEWFNKILYGSKLLIRDAVLSIHVEWQGKTVLLYKYGANECVVMKEEE